MKLLFLPPNFATALNRVDAAQLQRGNVSALSSILSPADVAFYIFANLHQDLYLPEEVSSSFPSLYGGIPELVALVESESAPEVEGIEAKTVAEIRRCYNDLKVSKEHSKYNGMRITYRACTDSCLVAQVEDTTFDTDDTTATREDYRELIEILRPYYTFEALITLPIVAAHLNLVSQA